MTNLEFIEKIAPYCQKYAKKYGFKICSSAIAQACLESAYGTSYKAKFNNFFGLKYRKNRVTCSNGYFKDGGSEQNKNGSYTPISDAWYSFENMEKGVEGYYQFINTNNYKKVKEASDSLSYLKEIKTSNYATALNYVENVYNVVKKWNLEKYDNLEDNKMSKYTNSSLVSYTNLSKNHSGERNHIIDTITIHCVVGQWTSKQGCDYFASTSRKASCNYIIGKNGDVGLCVEEKNRSWCSSNSQNDNRAITIEVASDTVSPYKITDEALKSLINLCYDICKRNNIKALKFSYDKNERVNHLNGVNMTCHRDFDNKTCPGDYIYSKEEYISQEVNKMLNNNANIVNNININININENKDKFNYKKYADDYSDLKKAFGYDKEKLWNHYLNYGKKEGRKVCFDLVNKDYLVKVVIEDLNIRESYSQNSKSKGYIKPGTYTIIEEKNGWGKLKSGVGWIYLKYTERI